VDLDSPGATIIICFPYEGGLNLNIPSAIRLGGISEEIKLDDEDGDDEDYLGSENIETEVREFLEGDRDIGATLH
jgi:hypothetical protein